MRTLAALVQAWHCVAQGMEEPTTGITGSKGIIRWSERGRGGVMLCQRALLERTSSAGNEPNRANFGTRALATSTRPRRRCRPRRNTDKMMIN